MTAMTSRERILAAARRQVPDRVPRDIWLESRVIDRLRAHFGTQDLLAAMRMDVASVGPDPSAQVYDYSRYYDRPGVTWESWGRGRIWDKEEHYAEYLYPLEKAETVDEILEYPWPDFQEPYRYKGLSGRVEALHARGYAVGGALAETIFEVAWQIRSMDRLLEDMMQDDEKAVVLLDQITDRRAAVARGYAEAGVDVLFLGDDVAMQTGLMMSRKFWRKWLGPRLKKVIDAAREVNPDLPVQYHSDGKINDLVPDLLDAGVTILNPVQPECVDQGWIKSAYGDRLAFWGGLGVQSVLPFGTPDEVRAHVQDVFTALGTGGGFVIGPAHVIERDTPLENILAMLEAIDQYGNYSE